tara:strand:+ start:1424 stop:2245 length:822 start_codon:yes stop_codon:yes gene_type:complete
MKPFFILICTTASLVANFDVQTSWFQNSLIDAEGTPPQPDVIDQTITGDPLSQYEETYQRTAEREGNGGFSLSSLDYQMTSESSPQGMVEAYEYQSSANTFSFITGNLASTVSYNYSTSTVFTTNESFSFESVLFSDGGQIQDFSLFVDDVLLWSGLNGFSGPLIPDVGGSPSDIVAIYGESTDFQVEVLGVSAGPSSGGVRFVEVNVDFGESEPEHEFEIMFDWLRTTSDSTGGGVAFFDYDLQLATVPEPSSEFLIVFSFLAALVLRRNHA